MHFQKRSRSMTKIRFILLNVILLGFINTLSARPQIKDSTEAYNYWAHRGIIEMVYAFMNDYMETVDKDKVEKNEIDGKNKYKKRFILYINHNNKLPSLDKVSLFLHKNSWSKIQNKLFQPLLKNYKERVKLDSIFFAAKKPGSKDLVTTIPGYTNKNIHWNQRAKIIIRKYKTTLDSLKNETVNKQSWKEDSQSINTPPLKGNTDNTVIPQNRTNSYFNFSEHLMVYLLIFIGFTIVFFVGRISVLRKVKREIDNVLNHKINIEDLGYSFSKQVYKKIQKNSDLEKPNRLKITDNNLVESLKEENVRLKNENSEFKRKISQLENVTQKPDKEIEAKNNKENEANNIHEWEIKQPKTLKLFFSMPENDGSFIVDNGESSNDGRKYYRLEYIDGSETGDLYFIPGDRDKRAINRLESYLKPACDIENIENADSATNIEFKNPGKVSLRNDSWVIDSDNKVKIKLL